MKTRPNTIRNALVLTLLTVPLMAGAQDPDGDAADDLEMEFTAGLYYLDEDSYRFGKYTGLTDDGAEALFDFRIEKRPAWDSGDPVRWRLQGWRLGLDSRRLEFDYKDLGTQSFNAHYREIPNNRFSDGATPYRGVGGGTLPLAQSWAVAPGSNTTAGFLALEQSLANLKIDTLRRRMDLSYDRKLSSTWSVDIDYRHEIKNGERTVAGIFGSTGGNPRGVILPAPVDYTTDIVEAMFRYATSRVQFGVGGYASFFSNDETSLVWQNAFGRQPGWAESVSFPDAQGRMALEPDNSYIQVKGYAGFNLAAGTRLTFDAAYGKMEQDDALLPYTINPNLIVHTPLPLNSADAEINTTMFNARLTTQLARRLGLAVNYFYDDRDNKTPRANFPYIAGDSQNQRPVLSGRINLPYSYTKHKADAVATYRVNGGFRFKGGVEYSDYSRDYSEVNESDELTWLAGVKITGLETAAFHFDYRNSSRDVDAYIGNRPFIQSHVPGSVGEDEWENHPLLRKYFQTDRDRDEYRFRADFYPTGQLNVGLSASHSKDDYGDGYFGLREAKIRSRTIDFGWFPMENTSLTAFYTKDKYDAFQTSRTFRNAAGAADPANDWSTDTADEVDTYNVALVFGEIGAGNGWSGFELGFDYTYSNTESLIDVQAVAGNTLPLPELGSKFRSFSAWGRVAVGARSSIRLSVENNKLDTEDFALDGVVPATLTNVLLLGESAANYDLILVTGSWTLHF